MQVFNGSQSSWELLTDNKKKKHAAWCCITVAEVIDKIMQHHQPQHSFSFSFVKRAFLHAFNICAKECVWADTDTDMKYHLKAFQPHQILWALLITEPLQMFLSILLAAVGVAGGLYSFIVALAGVGNGPLCKYKDSWTTPFKKRWQTEHFDDASKHDEALVVYQPPLLRSNWTYLSDFELWADCIKPENVVMFNTTLFVTLIAASCVQMLLCAVQMINGLFGCLCGTCHDKEVIKVKRSHVGFLCCIWIQMFLT